jgi:2-methylisocitrate lyase-like PEP mutase family enzyme
MISQVVKFRELHKAEQPLLLGNVWNVQSAKIFQQSGYAAIGTSSAAVAHSIGYEDGENMPFEDYFFIINRIVKRTTLPVTVDLEAGYGSNAETIFNNIKKLAEIGVSGINLEDSIAINGTRQIENKNNFASKIETLTRLLKENGIDIFINVRCDTFLLKLPNALKEAIDRIKLYETKSIDGVFLPCIIDENDIQTVVANTSLPLNVLCMPGLPGFEKLKSSGVKRISMGNSVNEFGYKKMEEISKAIITNQNFLSLF